MIIRLLAVLSLLLLAACGDASDTKAEAETPPAAAAPAEPAPPADATPPAETTAPAETTPPAADAEQSPAEILAGNAPYTVGEAGARGCKDRVKARALIAAAKDETKQAEYIQLWSEGMQDQSCRAFTTGLGASIEKENEDGLDCILSIDDPQNTQCFWIETGLLVKR